MGHVIDRANHTRLIKLLKQGSYNLCCEYLEALIPIHAEQSLVYLTLSVQAPKEEIDAQNFAKFITFLNVRDEQKLKNMRNYLSSVYHIFKVLITQEKCNSILSLLHLLEIPEDLNKDNFKVYNSIGKQIVATFRGSKSETLKEDMEKFLNIFIKYGMGCNIKDLLLFLQSEAIKFNDVVTNATSSLFVSIMIDCLIGNSCDVFKESHFRILCDILRRIFIKNQRKSTKHQELTSCIRKLHKYALDTVKDKNLLQVIEYYKSTEEFYETVDQKNLQNPEMFLQPSSKLREAMKTSTTRVQLGEVVAFSLEIFVSLRNNDRELINKVKPLKFTKDLDKSLTLFITHAKFQGNILESMKLTQKCCCSIDTRLIHSIQANSYAFEYVVLILRKVEPPTEISTEITIVLHKLVAKIIGLLERLKIAKCGLFKNHWMQFYPTVMNMTFLLAKAKRKDLTHLFAEVFVQGIFKLDQTLLENAEIQPNCIVVFYYLADSLVAYKRWSDVKDICVLAIKTFKNDKSLKLLAPIWNTAIYNTKIAITWCEIYQRKSEYLQSLHPSIRKLTEEEGIELLRMEITNYVTRYQNWKQVQLCLDSLSLKVNAEDFVKFLLTLSTDTFYFYQYNGFLQVCSSQKSQHFNDETFSGVYNFLVYKNLWGQARENLKSFPKVDKINKLEKKDPEEALDDANIKFTLSNYSHVNMKVFKGLISTLKQALEDFSNADKGENKTMMNEVVLDLIMQLSDEFELHCDVVNAAAASYLALKLSEKLKNLEKYIQVVTKLLNTIDMNKTATIISSGGVKIEAVIKNAEEIIEKEESISKYTKFAFYTELAMFYLHLNRLTDYRSLYHKSYNLYCDLGCTLYTDCKEERSFECDFATAHFTLLLGEMEMVPCNAIVDEIHGSQTFQKPMLAFDILMKHIQQYPLRKRTPLHSLFFKIGEHIVWKYYWSGMLKDAMMYAKILAVHAEHKILPYRLCRLLIFMGKIKARCLDMNTCQTICNSVEDILQLQQEGIKHQARIKQQEMIEQDGNKEQDDIKNQGRIKEKTRKPKENLVMIRDASPTTLQQFILPEFIIHKHCKCLPCTCAEYQTILIEKYHLDALIANYYKDFKLSTKIFQGCFKLYKTLEVFKIYTTDIYAELLWTQIQIAKENKEKEGSIGFDRSMAFLNDLFAQRRCRNMYISNHVDLMKYMLIVEGMLAKNKVQQLPKSPDEVLEVALVKTPETKRKQLLPEVKTNRQVLEVPDMISTRTRMRGRKNLFNDCSDKSSEGAVTLKVGVKSGRKATRSPRKPIR